jgi:hypothetical protein
MRRAVLLLCLAITAGCGESIPFRSGADQPIQVEGGQFFEGPLPTGTRGPAVTTVDSRNNLIVAGETGKKLTGLAEDGAYSIALRFSDIGSGYWVVPVGPPDPQTAGQLSWTAICDIARETPPGNHTLEFSAADSAGRFGAKNATPVLVQTLRPSGRVVVSLTWDTNADLDLHLVAPDGKELDPKHPNSSNLLDGGAAPPGNGLLDRDSNANCVIDGYREEDVVWQDAPAPGTYLARVDMFSACGAPIAHFVFSIWENDKEVLERNGEILAVDADGGGPGSGMFVSQFHF